MKSKILIIIGYLYFFLLGFNILSLTFPDEGRNAFAAFYMYLTKNFLVPYYNCHYRFEKPPLIYWITDIFFYLFGVHGIFIRFPSLIFSFLIIFLAMYMAKDIFNVKNYFFVPFILLSFVHLWIESKAGVPEMTLSFFETAAIFFLLKEKIFSSYIAMSFAMLAKGPVGIVIPLLVSLSIKRDLSFVKKLFNIKGIIAFILIGCSWYIYMIYKFGFLYIYAFFIRNNIDVYTGQKNIHLYPFYYYIIVILIAIVFWIPYLPIILKRMYNSLDEKDKELLIYFFVILIFFTLSKNKLHHYIISAYIPLSILIAKYIKEKELKVVMSVGFISYIGLLFYAYHFEQERFVPKAKKFLSINKNYPVYFYNSSISSIVFYKKECISALPNKFKGEAFVITKKDYVNKLKGKVLFCGKEFDGNYCLVYLINLS